MKLSDLGEIEVIRRLQAILPLAPDARLCTGVGDDCAVWREPRPGQDLLLTSDSVIENVHFLPDEIPRRIGHKALARTLSDLAAMGGEAGTVLVNVMAPGSMDIERLEAVYRGLSACAEHWGITVAGGDVASAPIFALHVFATGYVPEGRALLRSGARPGDMLYVSGCLGGSMVARHLDFQPRLKEGQWLRAGDWATAAMDVSDGLATDLRHLLEASGVGARLIPGAFPVSDPARQLDDGRKPWEHALYDGEDYELLFTVSKSKQLDFERLWGKTFRLGCACIGEIVAGPSEIELHFDDGRQDILEPKAFEHFKAGSSSGLTLKPPAGLDKPGHAGA